MHQEPSPEQDPDDSDAEFVEVDPSGRYGRVSVLAYYLYIFDVIKLKYVLFEICNSDDITLF